MNTHQLMWLCARYERKCQGAHQETDTGFVYPLCFTCKGTGRIPLLEGVREPCIFHHKPNGDVSYACEMTHCLGWTPTEDMWEWFKAARRVFPKEAYQPYIEQGKDAFFSDLRECLCLLAVNAAEAQDWVDVTVLHLGSKDSHRRNIGKC